MGRDVSWKHVPCTDKKKADMATLITDNIKAKSIMRHKEGHLILTL